MKTKDKEALPAEKSVGRAVRCLWRPFEHRSNRTMVYVNPDTGEVKDGYPPSKVDSSKAEPLDKLVAKFMMGEIRPEGMPIFEVKVGMDAELAIANFDPARSRGFDKVDAGLIVQRAKEAYSEHAEKVKQEAKTKVVVQPDAGTASAPPPAELGK